jgi:hypothetical protein
MPTYARGTLHDFVKDIQFVGPFNMRHTRVRLQVVLVKADPWKDR